jgi:hypothetical protein
MRGIDRILDFIPEEHPMAAIIIEVPNDISEDKQKISTVIISDTVARLTEMGLQRDQIADLLGDRTQYRVRCGGSRMLVDFLAFSANPLKDEPERASRPAGS